MIRCVAVDDEPHALKILSLYVAKIPFLELSLQTTSPWEALEYVQQNEVDLLFLDIQMDELTGLQLLDVLGPACPVILTTAYAEYALQGYEYQVLDYLLKPYSFDRFLKAVQQAKAQKEQNTPTATPKSTSKHILIKGDAKNKFHRLSISEILYVEGLKNYVQFICESEKVITLQNLKNLELLLPQAHFYRIHKSYIINLQHIRQIEGNVVYINEQVIPIGSSYRKAFFERMEQERLL